MLDEMEEVASAVPVLAGKAAVRAAAALARRKACAEHDEDGLRVEWMKLMDTATSSRAAGA
jgi:hypothetical protein